MKVVVVFFLFIVLALQGCMTSKAGVKVSLTPEQIFDAAKLAGTSAEAALKIVTAALQQQEAAGKHSPKLAIYQKALAGLHRFNVSVQDVDFSGMDTWRAARDELFRLLDSLMTNDVAQLNDPVLTAEITGGLDIIHQVIRAFDKIPAQPKLPA